MATYRVFLAERFLLKLCFFFFAYLSVSISILPLAYTITQIEINSKDNKQNLLLYVDIGDQVLDCKPQSNDDGSTGKPPVNEKLKIISDSISYRVKKNLAQIPKLNLTYTGDQKFCNFANQEKNIDEVFFNDEYFIWQDLYRKISNYNQKLSEIDKAKKKEYINLLPFFESILELHIKEDKNRIMLEYRFFTKNSSFHIFHEVYEIQTQYLSHLVDLICNRVVEHLLLYNPYFDSKIIAILNDKDSKNSMVSFDRIGNKQRIIDLPDNSYSPVYIKNLNYILYINNANGEPILNIVIPAEDGTFKVNKLNKEFTNLYPRITSFNYISNTNAILFTNVNEANKMQIVYFDLKDFSSEIIYTTKENEIALSPVMSNNGDIFFSGSVKGVHSLYKLTKYPIIGYIKNKISEDGVNYLDPALSLDNKFLAFKKSFDGRQHVAIMNLNDNGERILFSANLIDTINWAPNSLELTFSYKKEKKDRTKIGIVDIYGNFIKTIEEKDSNLEEPFWIEFKK